MAKQGVLGIIPARMGSTRFPGKMLALIAGKSLIQRTFENASRCSLFDRIVIATDHPEIYEHARQFNAPVVMTSPSCPTGTDRIAEVAAQEAYASFPIICNIQGDEPCVAAEIFEKICKALENNPQAVMATARVPLSSLEEAARRSVVKCVTDLNGHALYFSRALIPAGHQHALQKHVAYYRHIGLYAFRREFLLLYPKLPKTPLQEAEDQEALKILEHGYVIQVITIDAPAIGVDLPEDITQVEQFLCAQSLQ